jgi:uncharacterized membrane protein
MSLKQKLLASASLSLAAGAALSTPAMAADSKPAGEDKCWGITSCGKSAACAVDSKDVDATKAAFGDKFAKTKVHGCAGQNICGGSMGQLNWVKVPKGTCIKEKKGFLIEEKAGKKVVVAK